MIEQGWDLMVGIRARFGFGPRRLAAILGEHRRLIEAICRRDTELAASIAREHTVGAKQDLLEQMEAAGL